MKSSTLEYKLGYNWEPNIGMIHDDVTPIITNKKSEKTKPQRIHFKRKLVCFSVLTLVPRDQLVLWP